MTKVHQRFTKGETPIRLLPSLAFLSPLVFLSFPYGAYEGSPVVNQRFRSTYLGSSWQANAAKIAAANSKEADMKVHLEFDIEVDKAGLERFYQEHPGLLEEDQGDVITTLRREALTHWDWEHLVYPSEVDRIYDAAASEANGAGG